MSKHMYEDLKGWVMFLILVIATLYCMNLIYKHQNYSECVKNKDNPPSCRELL